MEPKGLTVALHWRNVPQHKDWVLAFAERQHEAHGLLVHQGRAERELRPPHHVDKGTVIHALVAEHDDGPERTPCATRRRSVTTWATFPPSTRWPSSGPPMALRSTQ